MEAVSGWERVGQPLVQLRMKALQLFVCDHRVIVVVVNVHNIRGILHVEMVVLFLPGQLGILWNLSSVDMLSLLKVGIFRILNIVEERVVIFRETIVTESKDLWENSGLVEEMSSGQFFHHDMIKGVDVKKSPDWMRVRRRR